MSKPSRFPQGGPHPIRAQEQSRKRHQSHPAIQPKIATPPRKPKQPAAPPAYRPQPIPKVLQRKLAVGQQPPKEESGRMPAAPPVYRPQPKQLQPPRAAQVRPAMQVGGAKTLQAKAATPAQRSMAQQPQGRTEKLRTVERPGARRFHAPPQAAAARPKSPANVSSQARTPGQLRVAQLKQNPAPPSVGRPHGRNALIQAKWKEDGSGALEDERVRDQWYDNPTKGQPFGSLHESLIKVGKEEAVAIPNSVARAILADNLANPANNIGVPIINTGNLKRFNVNSNFKDFFEVGGGKIVAVFKEKNKDTLLQNEVATLNQIANAGLATPNAKVVDVLYKGYRTKGILMDKVEGTYVDMAKWTDLNSLMSVLDTVVRGKSADVSEANLAFQKGGQAGPRNQQVADNIIKDLDKLLESQKNITINDLQFIVKPDGRIVIIDPQWAGDQTTLKKESQEWRFINETYERMKTVRDQLKPKQVPPKVPSFQRLPSVSMIPHKQSFVSLPKAGAMSFKAQQSVSKIANQSKPEVKRKDSKD